MNLLFDCEIARNVRNIRKLYVDVASDYNYNWDCWVGIFQAKIFSLWEFTFQKTISGTWKYWDTLGYWFSVNGMSGTYWWHVNYGELFVEYVDREFLFAYEAYFC